MRARRNSTWGGAKLTLVDETDGKIDAGDFAAETHCRDGSRLCTARSQLRSA